MACDLDDLGVWARFARTVLAAVPELVVLSSAML
jgi:hypothetical protein